MLAIITVSHVLHSSSHREEVAVPLSLLFRLPVGRERGEPVDGEAPEDGLHALPPRLPHPARLNLLQRLDALEKESDIHTRFTRRPGGQERSAAGTARNHCPKLTSHKKGQFLDCLCL